MHKSWVRNDYMSVVRQAVLGGGWAIRPLYDRCALSPLTLRPISWELSCNLLNKESHMTPK